MGIIKDIDEEIIEDAQHGSSEAINQIFEEYEGFVFLKAKNYFLMGADRDDLIQEGMIGLLKAIRGYDREKLASFKTFASICIKRQIITAIKSANCQKNLALNTAVGIISEGDENKELVYVKGLESYVSYSPEEIYLTKEQLTGLKDHLESNLSSFETIVFNMMVTGLTYKDIATKMEKKVKSVDNAIQRIKRKSEIWIEDYKR